MSPHKFPEDRRKYQKDRYHRLKAEREKKDPWVNEVYPGYEPESETEAEDFDHVSPQEYDQGVGRLFEAIEDPRPEPEKIREIPEDTKPIPEHERPEHLQDLTDEAETEIIKGVSSLLFDRVEKVPEKDDKNQKTGVWGRIIGD